MLLTIALTLYLSRLVLPHVTPATNSFSFFQTRHIPSKNGFPCIGARVPRRVPPLHRRLLTRVRESEGLEGMILGHGGRLSGCDVGEEGGLRGLFASEDIEAGRLLVEIPSTVIFTPRELRAIGLGTELERISGKRLTDFDLMIIGLVLENSKGENSFWYPFLRNLPSLKDFKSHPLMFQRDLLAGTAFSRKLMLALNDVIKTAELHKDTFHLRKSDILWAYLILATRCFGVPREKVNINFSPERWPAPPLQAKETRVPGSLSSHLDVEELESFLVPYIDLINHNASPNLRMVITNNTIAVQSVYAIPKGSQLFLNYGQPKKSDLGMLLGYGFLPDQNVDLIPSAFVTTSNPNEIFEIFPDYAHPETQVFVTRIRAQLWALSKQEMGEITAGQTFTGTFDAKPISLENEMQTLELLRKLAVKALTMLPGLCSTDMEMLRDLRTCILIRSAERYVLSWLIKLHDVCMPYLATIRENQPNPLAPLERNDGKGDEEALRLLGVESLQDLDSRYRSYIAMVVVPLVRRIDAGDIDIDITIK